MPELALSIPCDGALLAAELSLPDGLCHGAVILLHPAGDPTRRQFLFEHLAQVLPAQGVAVLRYDRRDTQGAGDIPYLQQADDLSNAYAYCEMRWATSRSDCGASAKVRGWRCSPPPPTRPSLS